MSFLANQTTIILSVLIFVIIIISLIIILYIKNGLYKKKMYNKIYTELSNIIEERKLKDVAKLTFEPKKEYDFFFETRTHIYYIKVLMNKKNYEVCVNNKTKWQFVEGNNAGGSFIDNVDGLMNLEVTFPTKKIVKKLYIFYPNAKTLMRYINECELSFIYPNTDVYGCNIITYQNLHKHPEVIEAK